MLQQSQTTPATPPRPPPAFKVITVLDVQVCVYIIFNRLQEALASHFTRGTRVRILKLKDLNTTVRTQPVYYMVDAKRTRLMYIFRGTQHIS